MDNLRWILIVVGVLVLLGIVLFANPNRPVRSARARKPARPSAAKRVEPKLDVVASDNQSPPGENMQQQAIAGLEAEPPEQQQPGQQPAAQAGASEPVDRDAPEHTVSSAEYAAATRSVADTVATADDAPLSDQVPGADQIVTLYVVARQRHPISGVELLDAALKAGLSFGAQDIFHRLPQGSDKPMFSMANLTAPGYFDRTAWNLFETQGVTLFMTLPGPTSALVAWDSMLATAERLAELLKAEVQDQQRQALTRQTIAHQREAMRSYDRQQH